MKTSSAPVLAWLLLAAACATSGVLSYRAYSLSRELAADQRSSAQALKTDIEQLSSRIAALSTRVAAGKGPGSVASRGGSAKEAHAEGQDDGRRDAGAVREMMASLDRLGKVIDSTGLEGLSASENMDPKFLQSLYASYVQANQVRASRDRLMQRNRDLHRMDQDHYGDKLKSLYQLAHSAGGPQRGGMPGGQPSADDPSEKAFVIMVEQYPDAYATGMVIAERALDSAMQMSSADVAYYYDLLSSNPKYASVVTDFGVEAVPVIQNYLARDYLQQGRTKDAAALIDAMETSYGDAVIADRSPSGEPNWVPVSQVVQGLRQQLQEAASSQAGGTGAKGSATAPPLPPWAAAGGSTPKQK